jgi:hypothetical protein
MRALCAQGTRQLGIKRRGSSQSNISSTGNSSNKRVDREHQHTNEQGGEGESRESTTEPLRPIASVSPRSVPEGEDINISLLEHVSPIEWENVILYGQYVLNPDDIR